jgi:RNA polymerase sigma-70 factor (ECF subfamily)
MILRCGLPHVAKRGRWNHQEIRLNFFSFDEHYLRRLAEGDAECEEHFSLYFGRMLRLKLRSRLRSSGGVEDIIQETLFRVIQAVRKPGTITQPDRLGAFVHSVCTNVMREYLRREGRYDAMEDQAFEVEQSAPHPDSILISEQRVGIVRRVLEELPEKERDLLRKTFIDEEDRSQLIEQYGVSDEYFRVLLFRARLKFRELLRKANADLA